MIASRIHAAHDSAARRQGLLNKTQIETEEGLWIDPCEAVHTFGMAVCMDAAFLDTDLRVKKIVSELKPNRIAFCLTASSVLEVRAGALKASGTEYGDRLVFRRAADPTEDTSLNR